MKIVKVERVGGQVLLTFEDQKGEGVSSTTLNARLIEERIAEFRKLFLRQISFADVKQIIAKLIAEQEASSTPLGESFAWEKFIGVEFEL